MKIVQLNGGSLTTFKSYLGPERELTVETTNWELRLHDNETPGGIRFLNLTQNDQRYQGRQAELDGFNFGANLKGWLVRVSPGVYKIRTLEVDTNSLSLTNPQGLLANPRFSLAPIVQSNHEFSGDVVFSADTTVGVEWVGKTRGLHVGDSVGDLTGNVTGNVVGDLLGNSEGNHTGGLDTQGAEVFMDPGQIELAWLSQDIIDLIIRRGVPVGGIMEWSGTTDNIPEHWALCDGNNGTPNLSGTFVRAAGPGVAPHSSGGSATHRHEVALSGPHLHTGTVQETVLTLDQIPSHRHLNGVVDKNDSLYNHGAADAVPTRGSSIDGNSSSGVREGYTTEVGGGLGHSHMLLMDADSGYHAHPREYISPESNLPVYYALAKIMKVA